MKKDILPGKPVTLRYTKGDSDIVSGVKQKDAGKLESKGAIGGSGTYRVNSPAALEMIVTINEKPYIVDVKNIIKTELGFIKFSTKRIDILIASLPHTLDFISQDDKDSRFNLDETSESVKSWLVYLKNIFS